MVLAAENEGDSKTEILAIFAFKTPTIVSNQHYSSSAQHKNEHPQDQE